MVGTVEDVVAMKNEKKQLEELTDRERAMIGTTVRLDLPMDSQYRLRQIADELQRLAAVLDRLSRDNALTPRQALIEASTQAFFTRRDIMKLTGRELRYPRFRRGRFFGDK
jgi:hypothetical protein